MKKKMNKLMGILTGVLGLGLTHAVMSQQDDSEAVRAQGGTGFTINSLRIFEPTESTSYLEDGEVVPATRAQGGTGFKIRYRAVDADPNAIEGTLDEVELINVFKGPVVSLDPLQVFAVDSLTSSQTFLADGIQLNDLQLGDEVKVSGFVDQNSFMLMTRIERVDALTEWKLTGYVEGLFGNQFNINGQAVFFNAGMVSGCGAPLQNGDRVEVHADVQPGFVLGDTLTSTQSVECVEEQVTADVSSDIVILEGFIDGLLTGGDFVLAGQTIEVSGATRYIRGRPSDIQSLIKVEVEGDPIMGNGGIDADKIRFLEPRINLTLPVEPSDFVGNQFNVAGVTLTVTPQVTDPDGIISNGLTETTRIRFRGYDYGQGELYISRLQQQGGVDYDDVNVTGLVTEINQPSIAVFGVSIDTTTASFLDQGGLPISAAVFFASIELGAEVEVDGASLDPFTDEISGGTIQLLEMPETFVEPKGQNEEVVIGLGTLTSTPDLIFSDSFE
ncbi:DUF5666 domain-containing protein [Marinicella meishanensis]|uniref:DUF5666 domain-containing protein n=1 Tax=Marinicella meishanensis TaxID=2873263 RepID=UPI001CC01155|nr:DUF5666 domain-containing protein [Marinicella sp. NBU2979]